MTDQGTARRDTGAPVILDATAISRLPWRSLPGQGSALSRVLWQHGGSLAGVLRVAPGQEIAPHAHPEAHHHVWVLEGSGRILGTRVEVGSYVHVPAGMDHAIEGIGPDGLVVFYLYQRVD